MELATRISLLPFFLTERKTRRSKRHAINDRSVDESKSFEGKRGRRKNRSGKGVISYFLPSDIESRRWSASARETKKLYDEESALIYERIQRLHVKSVKKITSKNG